jgi:dolichol-phosphate mannosyltransferase
MAKKIILLPAYNEEASLEKLLRKIQDVAEGQGWDYRILVCNDGSRDATGDILRRMQAFLPVETITHKINRGLGETIRDLFERAAEILEPDDIVVRLDCDDSHEPFHISEMIAKIDQGFDVVIASRFQPGGGQLGVSGYRAFVSLCANWFLRAVYRIPNLRDYSCGFRAYRGEMVRRAVETYGNDLIALKGLGFTCTIEKLLKFRLLGARFGEVPFVLRYDQKESSSKMIANLTTLGYLLMTLMYYWPWGGWRAQYQRLSDRPRLPEERRAETIARSAIP